MRAFHRHLISLIALLAAMAVFAPMAAQDEVLPAPPPETELSAGFTEALSLRMGELGARAPGQGALRLSLREGSVFLPGLPAEEAARLACDMALRAEIEMRFGSSPSRAALALRRSYAEMGAQGDALASGKLERVMERIQATAAGRGTAAAALMSPFARKPTAPGPGAGR